MGEASGRVMAVDWGEARIGLALSDALGMLAHPLETVPGRNASRAADRVAALAREHQVSTVLLGLPLRMDGSEGSAVEKVRAFARILRRRLDADVAMMEVDERLSTVAAAEKLRAAGRGARRGRAVIDQAAAMEILQEYLDTRPGGPPPLDEWDEWDEWEAEDEPA